MPELGPLRVLLVEDDDEDAAHLASALDGRVDGGHVERVARVADAVDRLATGAFDVVALDLTLPDAQGFAGVERLRDAAPHVPVVVLTDGVADERARLRAVRAGAHESLVKGEIDGAALLRAARYAVARARSEDATRALLLEQIARRAAESTAARSRFLAEASQQLAATLDERATREALARLAVPRLGDVCIVDAFDEHRRPDRTVLTLADDADAASALQSPPPRVPVVDTGEPVFAPTIDGVAGLPPFAHDPRAAAVLARLGARACIVAPMTAHGRSLGAVTLLATRAGRAWNAEDVSTVVELAHRAALALDNARLYEEARRAARARDELLAVVSHDLRNPLNVIAVGASLLRRGADERQERQLLKIHRAVESMTRLILDLVEVARIEAGGLSVEAQPHDVPALLDAAVDFLRPLAVEKSVALSASSTAAATRVRADRERVMQVFSNLVGNAIKFTPAGRAVRIDAVRLGAAVRFSVVDEGPGIPPADLAHVFDRFFQARTKHRGGAGLGLAIAKGLVEAHGGIIWAENRAPQGAAFHFTLPVDGE